MTVFFTWCFNVISQLSLVQEHWVNDWNIFELFFCVISHLRHKVSPVSLVKLSHLMSKKNESFSSLDVTAVRNCFHVNTQFDWHVLVLWLQVNEVNNFHSQSQGERKRTPLVSLSAVSWCWNLFFSCMSSFLMKI